MKAITLLHHRKKHNHAKTIKNFDLKYLEILANSEQNNIINFKRLNFESTKNILLFNNKYFNSPKKENDIEKTKTPSHKDEDEKIKNIINNKAINTSLTTNYFFPFKKYYKNKLSEKMVLSEGDKNSHTNKIKENEIKNVKFFMDSRTLDGRHISNIDIEKYDLLPHFIKSNKKIDFKKNNFIFNQNLKYNSVLRKSVKNHTTMQSTLPTFSRMISPEKDNINKEEPYLSVSKKKLNNFDLSKSKHESISDIKKFGTLIKYRKNYPFVVNPKPLVPNKFEGLPLSVIKMNNKYSNILKKENEKVFRQYFSIISKEKFSKKFQNIVNKFEIKEKKIRSKTNEKNDNKEEEDNSSQENSLINENIISGVQLLKEINNKLNQKEEEIKGNKKQLFYKFKKFIIHLSLKIDRISVYLGEILATYKNPKNCYGFPATRDLFFAIKTKNLKLANQILDNNKYIVLDYDYFSMTALHWAAKYNFYQIIPKIIEYGSHIDKKDYIGETPLLICVKHNFIESSIFLLLNLASPFIKDSKGLNSLDYCKNNFKMKNIFNKIASLHYISILGPTKRQFKYISREFIEYVVNENKGDLELEAYNIIKEKYEYYKRKIKNTKLI